MAGHNIFLCSLIAFVGFTHASPYYLNPKSKVASLQADPFDDDVYNAYSEQENEMENDVFYNIILNDLLDEMEKEDEDVADNAEDPQKELEELQDMLDTEDGRWLDEITEEDENLPPNYHNTTEIHTNVGNEKLDVKESIDKATSKDGKSTWISNYLQAVPETRNQLFRCSLPQPCIDGEYCFETQFYSECMTCKNIGSVCVDDAQCCSKSNSFTMCVEGTCQDNAEPGTSGTICDTSDDCRPGLCCAKIKNLPQSVCKPLARLDEPCSPHLSSLMEIMMTRPNHYVCPCENGLTCAVRSTVQRDGMFGKQKTRQVCSRKTIDRESALPVQPKASNEIAPPSGLNNQDTVDPRWQARVETENDQRFANPYTLRRHQAMKKAIEMDSLNDLAM